MIWQSTGKSVIHSPRNQEKESLEDTGNAEMFPELDEDDYLMMFLMHSCTQSETASRNIIELDQ